VAAPRICTRVLGESRSHGIQVDVLEQRQQILVSVTEDSFVSALKEVPNFVIFPIEVLRISLVESLKDLRQRRLLGLDEKMHMVGHQHIGVQEKLESVFIVGGDAEISFVVAVIPEDALSLIPASYDMVKSSFKFDARLPCHAVSLS